METATDRCSELTERVADLATEVWETAGDLLNEEWTRVSRFREVPASIAAMERHAAALEVHREVAHLLGALTRYRERTVGTRS